MLAIIEDGFSTVRGQVAIRYRKILHQTTKQSELHLHHTQFLGNF